MLECIELERVAFLGSLHLCFLRDDQFDFGLIVFEEASCRRFSGVKCSGCLWAMIDPSDFLFVLHFIFAICSLLKLPIILFHFVFLDSQNFVSTFPLFSSCIMYMPMQIKVYSFIPHKKTFLSSE